MTKNEAKKLVEDSTASGRKSLLELEAKSLVSAWGVPVPRHILIKNLEDAEERFKDLLLPLVLKVVSPHIMHKTEAGGVIKGIMDRDGVKAGLDKIMKSIKKRVPDAVIEGFLLEETASEGVEVIIGGLRDPQFGPAVMFGIGGIAVELMKDVSYRIAPVDLVEALNMIKEVKSYPLLTGFRGAMPVDMDKLADAVVKLSAIISEVQEIKEVEINPLIASERGVMAVDARVLLTDMEVPDAGKG